MNYALVSVRAASTRLPEKCFLPFGEGSVLSHVISRCQKHQLIPVITTTVDDARIVDFAKKNNVLWYAGSTDDKLVRWKETCKSLGISKFVTVDCDDPFFDPVLTWSMSRAICGSPKLVLKPDMRAYIGSHGWAMSYATLSHICEKKASTRTEMIWHHFPDDVQVHTIDAIPLWIEKNIRLTLDYEEDYWLLRTVLREIGPDCSRKQVIDLFRSNPSLALINGFRSAEWSQRQNG